MEVVVRSPPCGGCLPATFILLKDNRIDLQLIRNATLRLHYGGHLILTDPYLAPRFALPSYTGKSPNPTVDLPMPAELVLEGIEMTLISHLHSDHFDRFGRALLPKAMPVLCQPENEAALRVEGFNRLTPVNGSAAWQNITVTLIPGQHGSGEVLAEMGPAAGFVLQAAGEPVVYWVGDTIWCPAVAEAIARFQPQVIITHSGGAHWRKDVLIVMDAAQTIQVCQAAPHSLVVAIHMEALDHLSVTRQELRAAALAQGIGPERLLIPADGEILAPPVYPGR
jgi:L-ascorbate metabolism protein UlaG (beta-lactamase superfamily)